MDPSVEVVNEKLICLKQNHNELIEMIVMDDQVPLHDRLLCLRCFKSKKQVSKYISIEEAQELIMENLYKLSKQEEEQKNDILKNLDEFTEILTVIRQQILQSIDAILIILQQWQTYLKNFGQKQHPENFIQDLKQLSQKEEIIGDLFHKNNQSYCNKIDQIVRKLIIQSNYQTCQQVLKQIEITQQQEIWRRQIQKANQNINYSMVVSDLNNDHNIQLIKTLKQESLCLAIAFNSSGSIMVAGEAQDIGVWNFTKGQLKWNQRIKSHGRDVLCLVFSKKYDWFASGSVDQTIICWKLVSKQHWSQAQPQREHTGIIFCLILNNSETQLISGSSDKTIVIWRVNCEKVNFEFDQRLEGRHTDHVLSISLNESESALVSCGLDNKIILWSYEHNNKWQFKSEITMDDFGYRVCFINDYQIIWQQISQGISHILENEEGQLIVKSELKLYLRQENDDDSLFPTILNKKKQLIVQKHNRFVYLLKQHDNGLLSFLSEPIDCGFYRNYGALTDDGQYLIIWHDNTKEFKIYMITYE